MVLGHAVRRADLRLDEDRDGCPRDDDACRTRVHAVRATVAVGGTQVTVTHHGSELSWRATHGGGLTLHVTGPHGWVTYVGRIAIR